MSSTPAIDVAALEKRYGATRAVDGLSLTIAEGEVFGLLGPNGAGKTTTVEILEGYRKADAGEVRVFGLDPWRDGAALRPRMLELARDAASRGEVPIGCVVVQADGVVLAEAANRTETDRDPTAHAELLAIRIAAAKAGAPRLVDCDLYVTLEPCTMCAGAISFARTP